MDPRPPTREDLAKFFADQRSLVAFERLFEKVGVGLPSDVESAALSAGNAEARATIALGLVQMLADLLDKAPPHAVNPDEWISPAVVTPHEDLILPPYAPGDHVGGRSGHPLATATEAGFMSPTDKAALEAGVTVTLDFGGGLSGDVDTLTFTDGILTAYTLIP